MGLSDTRPEKDGATFRPQHHPPRSVYIHIPFCRHRCGYCNFTLVAGRDYLIDRFLNALETEVNWIDQVYEIDTLFLGGGTPSHLSESQLNRLRRIIEQRFTLSSRGEVTAECNPNDLSESRAEALAALGVNRISLGVQSLNPAKLIRLERDHSPAEVRRAIEIARDFAASVSVDLIFAAPEESLIQWQEDLQQMIALAPDHLSTYELTYEKGTRFWNRLAHGDLVNAEEDLRAEMYLFAIESLREAGMEQYEISSFARPGNRCRHNLGYWLGDPYFAFGPGAARFVDGVRETNHQSTMRYLRLIESNQSPVADREQLDARSAAQERLAIGLRMTRGLNAQDFKQRTGFQISEVLGKLKVSLLENGLVVHSKADGNWRLTRRGALICDWIAAEIVGQD